MKSVIDNFDSSVGWSGSSVKATVHAENELREYIAGLNSKSLIFKFDTGANGEYVQKTLSFDLTGHDEIVFHFWSRNKKNFGIEYSLSENFAYKIEFGDAGNTVFYIPTFSTFGDITMKVSGIGACTKIRITCLHDNEDYIIVSYLVSVKDELPKDIFQAVKEQIEYDLGFVYSKTPGGVNGKGILVGTVNGTTGKSSIIFQNPVNFLERYAVIMIEGGGNSEIHQIDKTDELEFFFFSIYDGKTLKNNYTGASVYLIIPVEYGLGEKDILLPGISLWGMNPEEVLDQQTKLDSVRDTFKTNETVSSRNFDTQFRYIVMIDCEARQNELVAFMSLIARYFIAREALWVNGKLIEIKSQGPSTYVEPTQGYNQIPKIQYTLDVTIKEEVEDRAELVKTIQNTRTFIISREVL